jgi:AraC-like DNA-binding protein
MKHIYFSKPFVFSLHSFQNLRHTDNSAGIDVHYVARMRSGSARIRALSGEEIALETGDIFYLPQGLCYHSYWYPAKTGTKRVEWESYAFSFLPSEQGREYALQKVVAGEEAVAHLDALFDALQKKQPVTSASVGHLYLFLDTVLPAMRVSSYDDPSAEILQRAISYISKNPDFRVSELAKFCNVSESGLYGIFRSRAGASPIDIKNRILIERACDLLVTTDQSVEQIATKLGFCSSAYFRKIFVRTVGSPPRQFRKENRQ